MNRHDVIVIGAGISGLSFAFQAVRHGRSVLVLERDDRPGGCMRSQRIPGGHWFEMGAHTAYNSYAGFLEIAAVTGATGRLIQRGPARTHFGLLQSGSYTWLTPPKILLQLNWLEAGLHFPVGFFRSKEGRTIQDYYSRLVGPRNYRRVLAPFLAAVPSQSADRIPASGPGSLFKSRERRKDLPRSYGFDGGLSVVPDAIASMPGITLRTGTGVASIASREGAFEVTAADGSSFSGSLVALALPPDGAAALLSKGYPAVAEAISRVATIGVESLGVALPRSLCWMPQCAFVVGAGDLFYSCVTRDPFPDPERRSFSFHFKPGLSREQKLRRMSEVLKVPESEFGETYEARYTLPSPALGHSEAVRAIDRALEGVPLAVTGNYFAGLAIEDCVQRSFSEWERVTKSGVRR
jgi:protoporphyrinogen/coproporphyrinogen III oxidase